MSLVIRRRRLPPDQTLVAQPLSSAQLFVEKRKTLVRFCRRKDMSFFIQMVDQRIFETTTLNIEFYANLIIAINSLGDF